MSPNKTLRGVSFGDLEDETVVIECTVSNNEYAVWRKRGRSFSDLERDIIAHEYPRTYEQTCPECGESVFKFYQRLRVDAQGCPGWRPQYDLEHVRMNGKCCVVLLPDPPRWWVRLLKWIIQ